MMPYDVKRLQDDGTWEVLYSEDDALKADLLMAGLSVKTYGGNGRMYIDPSGLCVEWRDPAASGDSADE